MRPLVALAALALALPLAGCGYSQGSLMPPGIRTVSIPVFSNDTFRRNFEITLTRSLHEEILSRTDLKLAETQYADSILEGTIVEVDQPVLVEDARDDVTEQQVFITVDFVWRDLRTGEVIRAVRGLQADDRFVVPLGQNLDLAFARALDRMAEAIVNEMENRDW